MPRVRSASTGSGSGTSVALAGPNSWTGTQDFTGATVTAPTQAAGDNSTKVATTAFTAAALAALVNSAPGVLDTLGELAAALQADEGTAAALATTVASKASKAQAIGYALVFGGS